VVAVRERLSEDERADPIAELRQVIVARMANDPGPGRTRDLISPILFPTEDVA
jgi:hypothetical protein